MDETEKELSFLTWKSDAGDVEEIVSTTMEADVKQKEAVNTLSDEWIDYLDSRYTMFEKHQQAREISDNDQPVTTQTIMVNTNTIRKTEKTKYQQEIDIDRIVIQETPEEQRNLRSTLQQTDTKTVDYKIN